LGELGNSIVPVELTSFSANVVNRNVTLNWITATELNNLGFEIERSVISNKERNLSWEKSGFVSGHGTTSESQSYSFNYENVSFGTSLYRLKQIDFDGSFIYSNIVEVEIMSPDEFSLYQNFPNPFNPSTKIRYSVPQLSQVQINVFDVLGNKIETLVNEVKPLGTYEIIWNAANLPSGVYFYKLQTAYYSIVKKMSLTK
jgi:hypothetical protein